MKKVMVFGTFDIIHPGHKNFFKQARKYGEYLIVVVARDKTVKEVKGKMPANNEKARLDNIKKSGLVNEAVLGNLKDKYKNIKELKPDVICLGYDQINFTDKLNNFNIKVIKLKPYKPEIYKTSIIIKHSKFVNS